MEPIKSHLVMDRHTKHELYRGSTVDGLYSLPLHINRHTPPRAFVASLNLWHQRLGHANLRAVRQLLSSHHIKYSSDSSSLCHGCSLSKIHKLPFPTSSYCASAPLELICSDLWGP
ncbi:unnamed protein product, partial [Linum tenue]